MKKLLLIILLIPALARSQQVDNAVTTLVTPIVTKAVNVAATAFVKTLDSGYTKKYQGYGNATVTIDTLNMRDTTGKLVNGIRIFSIYMTAWQGNGDAGWGKREIGLRYYNGSYTIISQTTGDAAGAGYAGTGTIAKASWKITIVGNLPVIQITGVAGMPITWIPKVNYIQ